MEYPVFEFGRISQWSLKLDILLWWNYHNKELIKNRGSETYIQVTDIKAPVTVRGNTLCCVYWYWTIIERILITNSGE